MGYDIIHRYECDGCGFKMQVMQANYGRTVETVEIPGFVKYGDIYLCEGCIEAITPAMEEGLDRIRRRNELRAQYGQ